MNMKVLVLTLNAWDDTGSTGNTISNLFKDPEDIEFANIYCRNEQVNNSLCHRYFKITESQILNNLCHKDRCGENQIIDNYTKTDTQNNDLLSNNNMGNFLRKYRPTSLLFLRELIWLLPVWKNKRLDKFLQEFNADVVYMHGHTNLYMHRLMKYCAKKSNAKIVMFYGDDMYGRKGYMPLTYLYESLYRSRLRRSIGLSSLLFGGSLKLCDEYKEIFGKDFYPMFKECDLKGVLGQITFSKPYKIVYAGNLLFGREKAIKELAQRIQTINQQYGSIQFQLHIYSNTAPEQATLLIINDGSNCIYWGRKPYSEVCQVLNNSEFSLFLESFDKSNIRKTRLSFSTKIIDCMQSDSALLAIGPKELASMDYIIKNKLGFVATSEAGIEEVLRYIIDNPDEIGESVNRKYHFARENHEGTSKKNQCLIKSII